MEGQIPANYVVFDVETTAHGFEPKDNGITDICIITVKDGQIVEVFSELINPEMPISEKGVELTGITDAMVANAPIMADMIGEIHKRLNGQILVAHNAKFDLQMVSYFLEKFGYEFEYQFIDTLSVAMEMYPKQKNKLNLVCDRLGIVLENAHRAYYDAVATVKVLNHMARKVNILEYINKLNCPHYFGVPPWVPKGAVVKLM